MSEILEANGRRGEKWWPLRGRDMDGDFQFLELTLLRDYLYVRREEEGSRKVDL